MKKLLVILILAPLIGLAQQDHSKMPPASMLQGAPGDVKNIYELSESSEFKIFNFQGEEVDSGSGEFVDLTDLEPGRYFVRTDNESFQIVKEEDPIGKKTAKNESNDPTEKNNSTPKQEDGRFLYITLIAIVLLLFVTLFILGKRINGFKKERAELFNGINEVKSNLQNQSSGGLLTNEFPIDREKILANSNGNLNESDWNIIKVITKTPSISNSDLAHKVTLSIDGTRSSLKKMYRIFEIPSSRNMKLALALKLLRLSKEEN